MRSKSNKRNSAEDKATIAASMAFGAIMNKIFGEVFDEKKEDGCNCEQTRVKVPEDGTAVELQIPDNFEVFISEDGKPMVRRKTEAKKEAEEFSNLTYEDIAKHDTETSCERKNKHHAYHKLNTIAKYLNKGWKPKFDGKEKAYFICQLKGIYTTSYNLSVCEPTAYFKTEELALQAIRIMGTEALDDLFNLDW